MMQPIARYTLTVTRPHVCNEPDFALRCIYQPTVSTAIIPEADTLAPCEQTPTWIIEGDDERNCAHVCTDHLVRVLQLVAFASPLLVYAPEQDDS